MRERVLVAVALLAIGVLLVAANGDYKIYLDSEVGTFATASSETGNQSNVDTTDEINVKGWSSVQFWCKFRSDTSTTLGLGLSCSTMVRVQTFRNNAWVQIDSTYGASMGAHATTAAVTYSKRWADDIADTLLGTHIRAITTYTDTCRDSVLTIHDSLSWGWYVK